MSRPAKAIAAGTPDDLVRLRDEIAMTALNAMIIAGGWGYTDAQGNRHNHQTMPQYSEAAYAFADVMLEAREKH
ncbi:MULTISPECIES: hypothetical protein [Pseudomonas]|uniref:hypothetical protein n=1 Tax=Pseudomonas TaxID=286 RepID=UPI0018AAC3B9|nr:MULTISPECIES: hypothetical protein [Pseudomonas]MBF8692382.1 hypothetical protein [Pseudomonas fulva]MBH3364802.1 hypothetical protein [Pseudomonas sp. URMO17WK12:I11]